MKNKLKHILITVLLLAILISLSFIPIGNNIILRNYTNELKNFKLNASYEIRAKDSNCGKLMGNGNGMQYLSAFLIYSENQLVWENPELEGVFLITLNGDSYDEVIDSYAIGEYFTNIENSVKKITNTEHYYILYSLYQAPLGSFWNADLRAH